MIVWKGWGILILPIVALCVAPLQFLTVEWLNFPEQSLPANLALIVGFFLSAIIIWFLGKRLNSKTAERVFVDKESGQEFKLGPQHSFFYIRMEYWAFILPVIAVIIFIARLVG
ncbi:hypothetical protein [Laceyella sacchari]|jgi:hypothetical protein|uniref:DUF3899 domain-containing protein n=1 Tax=Laceyella sacchari TaxID=37482 RepID=A0ABY5U2P7_LACSH|nr:hypothetical protein [Laceyella sacchari]TCW38960.1 hypothetical protein EDC32_102200 [Laceyella sacchari]UWE03295.1 hypothetical protein NYR52_14435 [Laceyella sacchari]